MANKIQTVMRTAAMIYAEEQSATTVKSVKRHFIDAALTDKDNTPDTIENIISFLEKEYELVIQETELFSLLNDPDRYEVILGDSPKENKYYLPQKRYQKLKEKSENTIDCSIREFISINGDIDPNKMRDLLYKYLYTLLNTNINAYTQLLIKKGEKVSPVIDSSSFEENEIELINKFIRWDNSQKDKALFELVNYCIEYASAINSIDSRDVIAALENKKLYLDNALIYRALGINGNYRKQRVQNLLQRCVDSGQQLLISSITRQEFFETIDFHIGHLRKSTPYGKINPALFRQYTGGDTIYQYYHEWKRTKSTYGYELFRIHIKNEYDAFLKKFKIVEDYKQSYSDTAEAKKIERYTDEIMQLKRQKHKNVHINDAKNMIWIENARKECDHNIRDTKYYFVTSDRKLQEWDLQHSKNQPITMLPSQWLALLLKYVSRTNDDYKCFVSFLAMPNETETVSPEKLQDILAGISEITEEFQKQDDIVSNLLELHKNDKNLERESAKQFAKEKIEAEYKEKIKEIEINTQTKMEELKTETNKLMNERIDQIMIEFQEKEKQNRIEKIDLQIDNCQTQLEDKQKLLSQIKSICDNKKHWLIGLVIAVYSLYVVSMIICTFVIFGWEKMEPITYYSGVIMMGLLFIPSLIKNKNMEFWELSSDYWNRCFEKQCTKFNFNESEIIDLNKMITDLHQQKATLESE